MGNRLSFLRRKRLKAAPPVVAVAEVPLVAPTPPPEKFDDSSFWVGLKAALKFKKGAAPTLEPLDRSLFHVRDPNKLSDEELKQVEKTSNALASLVDKPNETSPREVAMLHFTYALSRLALDDIHGACEAFKCTIQHDPTLGRAYTHLAHTLLLETQTDSTLEQIVGCLENALKYDDMEVRENTILMAEVYSMLGRHDMALQVYSRLENVDAEWENVFHMARCLWEVEEYEKSIELLLSLPGKLNAPPTPNQTLILADVNALIHPPMVATSCC